MSEGHVVLDEEAVADKRRVVGGLRTTVYKNDIRVDNIQHNLMAVMKITETFKPQDYVHEDAN